MNITLFTWGYYGWGNHTPELLRAVDAVEASRGYGPPLFVDIRIRRTVRAAGFQGTAFEKLLGPERHLWMKSLGNRFIETRTGPEIQIVEPSAASRLLDRAREGGERRQRLLFFCSCEFPREAGKTSCHRDTVADLVLEAARRSGERIEIVEWPGGEPRSAEVEVTSEVLTALRRGRASIPLGKAPDLATWAGLPWGSVVSARAGELARTIVSGPAVCHPNGWTLPVLWSSSEAAPAPEEIARAASELRRSHGFELRSST